MAILKSLIVNGASKFIGDAYFNIIKSGIWNGSAIDLTHGGTAGTTTANQVLLSTATSGTSAWSTFTISGTANTAYNLATIASNASAGAGKTSNITSHLYAGTSSGAANLTGTTTQADPYLILVEGSTKDSAVQLKAATNGGLTITAKAGGIIEFSNTALNSHSYTTNWEAVSGNNDYPIAISPNVTPTTSKNGYDADFKYNPSTNTLTLVNQTLSGLLDVNGTAEIDSLVAGNLEVQGSSALGNVTSGNWLADAIAVAKGGTGLTSLSSATAGQCLVVNNDKTGFTFATKDNSGNTTYGLWLGAQNATANVTTATANNATYINLRSSASGNNNIQVTGSGSTTVSGKSGLLTITSHAYSEVLTPVNAVAKSLISTEWGTIIDLSNTTTYPVGTYIIQVIDAGTKTNYYSGIMTLNGNVGRLDEIALHASMATGSDTEVPTRIYLALEQGILKGSSQDASATNHTLTVKINRMI